MLNTILAFSGTRIAVLGDVMLDRYVMGTAARISPEAPIPILRISSERTMPGGAANVARNIAALGGEVRLAGLVGRDEAAAALEQALSGDPLLQAILVCDPQRPTTLKTRFVAQGQQLLRVDSESTVPAPGNAARELVDAVAGALSSVRTLVLSDYAKGVLGPQVLPRVLEQARARGRLVIVDPKQVDMRCYVGADIITPNAAEAARMTGIDCDDDVGVVEAARRIGATVGCRYVVVTRGAKGMSVVGMAAGAEVVHLPTELREVHDVSGAGDTALAVLALALSAGAPIEIAARIANIAAGIAVSKPGTAVVPLDELLAGVQDTSRRREDQRVLSRVGAVRLAARWREEGRKIVFTNGCFDLLHPGHVKLIQNAKAEGDRLIVAINSDASVRRLKGAGRPIQSEAARAMVLASIEGVDAVVCFEEDTPLAVIEALQPDVLVKGADYREDEVVGGSYVRSKGGRVVLVPLEAGHSTSSAIARAAHGSAGGGTSD